MVNPKSKMKKEEDTVNKNFLLISLEEKEAKKIAEVINNDTSRKILDYLSRKDCTESELSKDLNIPISTVHYNLKLLVESKLVTVEEFHYSQKGKEVNHYTLANKYIIIAPKSESSRFMDALKKILPVAVITAGVAAVMGLINYLPRLSSQGADNVMKATEQAYDAAPMIMSRAADGAAGAAEISRPFMQSEYIVWFLLGSVVVIAAYFVYELVRKK